jgi:hypothetical protein
MTDLSPKARHVLEATRDVYRPDDADRQRVRRALLAQIAAGATVATLGTPAAAGTSAASGGSGAALGAGTFLTTATGKVVALIAAVVMAGAAGVVATSAGSRADRQARSHPRGHEIAEPGRPAETARGRAVTTIAERDEGPSPAPRQLERAEGTSTTTVKRGAGRRTPAAAPMQAGIAAEAKLVRDAHAALGAGDPRHALELLDHAESASAREGPLRQERTAARIVALCALGRLEEARGLTRSFVNDWPQSPLVARLRAACASGADEEEDPR